MISQKKKPNETVQANVYVAYSDEYADALLLKNVDIDKDFFLTC